MTNAQEGKTLTPEKAAVELNIPLIAIGQLMFEGLLTPKSGFSFDANSIELLKTKDLSKYR